MWEKKTLQEELCEAGKAFRKLLMEISEALYFDWILSKTDKLLRKIIRRK